MRLEYSETEKNRKLNTAVEIICALILGCACFYMFISMFSLNYSTGTMFSGGFTKGIAGIWNSIADTLGKLDYIILPKYKVETAADGTVQYGAALTLILAVFSLLSYLIIKSRIRLLLLIFVIPACVLTGWYKTTPSVYAGLVFAAALLIVLAVMNIGGKLKPVYFILPVLAVLLGIGATLLIENTVTLTEPAALSTQGIKMQESIDRMRYGSDPLPQGDLTKLTGKELKAARGDISSVKDLLSTTAAGGSDKENAGAKTALSVKMTEPDSYYLRGFVGSDYSRNRWNTLQPSTFYGMRDEIFWLNRRGFDGLSEMSYALELSGFDSSLRSNEMTVKVEDASKNIAFTPYELILKPASGEKARKSEMDLPKGTKNYGGSYLGTEGLSGKSEYKYKAAPNITGVWTDAVGRFYTTPSKEEIDSFFISESHYNVDLYDRYLDIPDSLVQSIEKEIGPPGDISNDHADYKEAIEVISRYLKEKYIYSESFGELKAESDFVQSFIDSKRGCDAHFASLAALLFRYFGIPARYVEGYLVTQPLVDAGSNGGIKVPKAANHAWTEIYIDGFGWVPFEATPEYAGLMKEADLTKGLQNVDYQDIQNDRVNATEEEPVEEENEENDDLGKLLILILKIVLIVIGSLILLFILIKILMALAAMIKWRRAFADKDPKAGIRALYQYSYEKNWKLSEAGENLGLVASYSKNRMQESDRVSMRSEVKAAKERAKAAKAAKKSAASAAKKSAEKSVTKNAEAKAAEKVKSGEPKVTKSSEAKAVEKSEAKSGEAKAEDDKKEGGTASGAVAKEKDDEKK